MQRFPNNQDVIDHLFSGSKVTIAKNMEWERAHAAVLKLRSIGAVVYFVDEDGELVEESGIEGANDPLAASGSYLGQHPDEVELSDEDETGEVEAASVQVDEPDGEIDDDAETSEAPVLTEESVAKANIGRDAAEDGDNTDPYEL